MKNVKIFICAHQPIQNELPKGEEYVIVAQNPTIKDNEHEVIYLTNDEFTQKHWRCYGEGCAMRYLWKHPELLPEYVGIAHYRRFFVGLIGRERSIPNIVNASGAIIMSPYIHSGSVRNTNWAVQCADHFEEDATLIRRITHRLYPKFGEAYEDMLKDNKQYACNLSIMKKEHFLEMCEICFTILDEFDKRKGFANNNDVFKDVVSRSNDTYLVGGLLWQSRMQGFYLEWLTDTFYRYKFNINKCRKLKIGLPNNDTITSCYNIPNK